MTKKITICADDFALTPEISDAIVSLIQNKRISAASCMTSMKHWQIDARKLLDLPVKADIGLHLNLTEPPFLILPGKFSLPELILKSYLNYLNEKIIEQELETQLLKFQEAMGRLPDFLDGHEHIHVLPVIRNIVIHLYEKYFPNKNAYIRLPLTRKKSNFKSSVIHWIGAKKLGEALDQKQIPHNLSFEGAYSFDKADQFPILFASFLCSIESGGLVMCHPGKGQFERGPDRSVEYDYLMSDQYWQDLKQADVEVCRFFS